MDFLFHLQSLKALFFLSVGCMKVDKVSLKDIVKKNTVFYAVRDMLKNFIDSPEILQSNNDILI